MKRLNRIIPIFCIALSVFLGIAAAVFFLWDHPETVTVETSVSSKDESKDVVSKEDKKPDKTPVSTSVTSKDSEPSVSEDEPEPEVVDLRVENPYKDKFLENSDMIAWIKIPDTEIDFPVMWTPFDEDYYLDKDFNKKPSKYGVPLLDTDSHMNPSSTNLIIHGHNFTNNTFYFLYQYKNEEYFKEHSKIYLYGKDCEHIYEVMAVFRSKVFYVTDTCFKYYKFFDANTEEEFNDFYDNVKAMALYDTGVTAQFGDKFLTLSTCSPHTENGRFVVVAKELEPGDTFFELEDSDTLDKENEN